MYYRYYRYYRYLLAYPGMFSIYLLTKHPDTLTFDDVIAGQFPTQHTSMTNEVVILRQISSLKINPTC